MSGSTAHMIMEDRGGTPPARVRLNDLLRPSREKHFSIAVFLLCIAPMLSLVTAGVYSEYDFIANSEMRWINTAFFLVPLLFLVITGNVVKALYAFSATIFFVKTLLSIGVISNSTLNIMALILGVAFFLKRKPLHQLHGVLPYLLLFILVCVQFLRAAEIVAGLNMLFGVATVGLSFYVIAPRLHGAEALLVLRSYLLGFVPFGLFLLFSYDWASGERLGVSIGLNPNNLGMFAATAIILTVYFHLHKKLSLLWGSFSFIVASLMLVTTSSRTFLLVTLIGLLLLFRERVFALKGAVSLGVLAVFLYFAIRYDFDSKVVFHLTKGIVGSDVIELEALSTLRWYLLQAGIELFSQNPVRGIGLANFADAAGVSARDGGHNLVAHNIYLRSAVELGIGGLILLLIWNVCCLWEGLKEGAMLGVVLTLMYCLCGLLAGNYLDVEYAVIWGVAFVLPAVPVLRLQGPASAS